MRPALQSVDARRAEAGRSKSDSYAMPKTQKKAKPAAVKAKAPVKTKTKAKAHAAARTTTSAYERSEALCSTGAARRLMASSPVSVRV